MRAAKATHLFMRPYSYTTRTTRDGSLIRKLAFGKAALRNSRAAYKDLRVPEGSVVRPPRITRPRSNHLGSARVNLGPMRIGALLVRRENSGRPKPPFLLGVSGWAGTR